MRSERGAVDGVSALVARPAQVTILTTAHRCPDQYAARQQVAVAAALGCADHPLAGGAEDQIADVVAYESGVHRRSTNLRCWYRAGFTTL